MSANPDIITNRNGHPVAIECPSLWFQPMPGSVYSNVGAYQAVMAYANLCHVEHSAVIIGMEIVAHVNVLTEVAVEVVTHKGITAHLAKSSFTISCFFAKSDSVRLFNCLTSSDALTISMSTSSLISVRLNVIFFILLFNHIHYHNKGQKYSFF